MKANVGKRIAGIIMVLIMLVGSTIMVHADTPICGGNHKFYNVREIGTEVVSDIYSHQHNGGLCFYYYERERFLQRCTCGAEQVGYGNVVCKHSR